MSDDTKQRLSDTFLTFLPKNTAGYTYQNQLIEVQIPKSEHVINLAKAQVYAKVQIPLKINKSFTTPSTKERFFVGMMNSATIFDKLQMISHNKAIYTDSLSQVNSRLWQLSKPSKYLDANYHSFINTKDVTKNESFIVNEIKTGFNAIDDFELFEFNMKIPFPCLFNCFDNVEAFSTTVLNDNVSLLMELSALENYLCLFITDENGKLLHVKPFDTKNQANLYDEYNITCSSAEGDKYQINEGFRIVAPGHYPTEEEKIEINNVIANGGWFRPYINTRIDAQDGDFGPNTTGNTIQSVINFSSEVHNLYNVIILSAHEHSHVAYDKPKISDIEVNASELWKLANNGTHVDPTYDGDTDMYQDLLNGFGTQTFKNLERFDDSITHDYLTKYTDNDLWVKVSFKLTISLNDTNDGFKDVTSGSSTYTPVDFKILNREIVTKKYGSVESGITSQSEIDKVSHKKTMYGIVFIKNDSTSSDIYTNKQINFYCDSTDPKNKFNFTGGTIVSNSSTSTDTTNEGTIKASVSEVSGDRTVKR